MKIAPVKLPDTPSIPKKHKAIKPIEIDYKEYFNNLNIRGMQSCGWGNYRFDVKSQIDSYY